jgi:hypothetical protein
MFVGMNMQLNIAADIGHQKVLDALEDAGFTVVPGQNGVVFVEQDDGSADMVSLLKKTTGVDNTIFIPTKDNAQHAARIKIAVDPPHTFNARSAQASMAIHDFSLRGADVPSHVVQQAKRFIDLNRDVLLDFWNAKIGTEDLLERLKKPEG